MGFPVLVTMFQGAPLCHQGQFAHSYVVGEKSYQASLVSGKYRSKCWVHIPLCNPGSLWCMELLCFWMGKQQLLCLYSLPRVGLPRQNSAMMAACRGCVITKGLSYMGDVHVMLIQACECIKY